MSLIMWKYTELKHEIYFKRTNVDPSNENYDMRIEEFITCVYERLYTAERRITELEERSGESI